MLKILIVDDDEGMAETLADVLVELGHEVIVARNGYEAIKDVNDTPVDIALIDVRMPGLDGVETFLRIKEARPDFPAYLMTGYATTDQVESATRNGILGVMHKPLDIAHLALTLEAFAPSLA